jgi:hypothetical protein
MENYTTFIALIVAILGLAAVILNLIANNKQIRRENLLEKRRVEEENSKKLELLTSEKEEEERKNEILQMSMNIIADYMENELTKRLSSYVTANELKVLDSDLKKYVSEKLELLDGINTETTDSKKDKVQKTIAEAFGIQISENSIDTNGLENFFSNRVERRIKEYNKKNRL